MPLIKLDLDSSGAVRGLRRYESESKKAGSATDRLIKKTRAFTSKISMYGAAISALTTGAMAMLVKKLVFAAGEMEDVQGKFDAVFKGMTEDAEGWAKTLRKNFDLSEIDAKTYMSSIQDIFVPMGMVRSEAAALSVQTVKLAADISAFNGREMKEVMENIMVATTGSYEVMKKYGVVLTVNKVKQEAVNLGLANSVTDVSDAARAQAAYSLILKGSKDALGAHEREQDSFNGQMKKAKKIISDLRTQIGQYFLPLATKLVAAFNKWASNQKNLNTVILRTIEVVRFLWNGWKGIELLAHVIIIAYSKMFQFIILGLGKILTPLKLVFDGLVLLRLIDFNPIKNALEGLTQVTDDFAKSAVEGIKTVWREIEQGNASFDKLKKGIIATGKEFDKTGKKGKKMGKDIASGLAKPIEQMSILEKMLSTAFQMSQKAAADVTKEVQNTNNKLEQSKDRQIQWNNEIDRGVAGYQRMGNEVRNVADKFNELGGWGSGGGNDGWGDIYSGHYKVPSYLKGDDARRWLEYMDREMAELVRDTNTLQFDPVGTGRTKYGTRDPHTFMTSESLGSQGMAGGGAYSSESEGSVGGKVVINVNQKLSKSDIPDLAQGLENMRNRA